MAVPIGQKSVQKPRPATADHTAIRRREMIPAAMPVTAPSPSAIQVVSTAEGLTAEAMLRIMFHGSTR